jgi:hypothetical protein
LCPIECSSPAAAVPANSQRAGRQADKARAPSCVSIRFALLPNMSASRRLHLVPQVGCSMLVAVPRAWCCHVHLLCACVYCHATVTSWHPPFTAYLTQGSVAPKTVSQRPTPAPVVRPRGFVRLIGLCFPLDPPSQPAPQQGFRFQTFLRLPPTLSSKFCTQPGLRRSPSPSARRWNSHKALWC